MDKVVHNSIRITEPLKQEVNHVKNDKVNQNHSNVKVNLVERVGGMLVLVKNLDGSDCVEIIGIKDLGEMNVLVVWLIIGID